MPAGLFARTFRLLPKGPVGAASPCHRGLHRLRFGFPVATHAAPSTHASRAATRPYSFVKLSKPWPGATSALEPRFFSRELAPAFSALVIAVIVVGGVTRLTESGLSITEWRPITGFSPLSRAEWESEFDKYKATPEFRLLNSRMALDDFKSIYYMEWGHRVLGRTVGLAFVLPLAYFAARGRLARTLRTPLLGMAALLGAQGALGWYMYRLAAHLGTALALYAGMFAAALSVTADWRFARDGTWGRLRDGRTWDGVLRNPLVRRFKAHAAIVTGLVFLTALSGAFVAGLDAGLVYTTTRDAADGGKGTWRNLFENPTTVQFDHRVLAMTTYLATALLFASTRRAAVRAGAPPTCGARHGGRVCDGERASGARVALLSAVLHVLLALRRPGAAARAWRQANLAREAAAKAKVTT
ncbi:electron transfer protein 1 [Lactarius hengduanensis]|nr:electron transfer protein 1 [Lactarius hengduanensis]